MTDFDVCGMITSVDNHEKLRRCLQGFIFRQREEASAQVIMNNCIRCHTQLTNEFVDVGRIDYMMTLIGDGKACWDCHRDVPHGGMNSLSSTPAALVPYPESPVPEWLQKLIKE